MDDLRDRFHEQDRYFETLVVALFDSFANSLWVQLRSASTPNLPGTSPTEPEGIVDITFSITRRERLRGLRLPVPSSPLPQPWGQAWGPNPEDWARTIRMWMEEQVAQGCDYWAMKVDEGWAMYFKIDQNGLRVDEARGRLTATYLNI